MQLRATASAKQILKKQSTRNLLKQVIDKNLRALERYFGSELFVAIPEAYQSTTLELLPILSALNAIDFPKNISLERFEKIPDEPFLWIYHAKIHGESYGLGADFFHEESAFWKCLAESVERYLWKKAHRISEKSITYAPVDKLTRDRLDLFSLAGFSDQQKKEHAALAYNQQTIFGWMPVRSLTRNKDILCPAQLMNVPYYRKYVKSPSNTQKKEPMLRWAVTTGLATGRSIPEAIVKGVLESIERDAYMISYLNRLSPDRIDLASLKEQDPQINILLASFERYRLDLTLLKLPTDFPVHVCFAILSDQTKIGPALVVASSADFNLRTCIIDTLAECLSSRIALRRMLKHFDNIDLDPRTLDRIGRLVYWARPEQAKKLDFMKQGKVILIDLAKEKNLYSYAQRDIRDLSYYQQKQRLLISTLRRKKYEALLVNLTTRESRRFGLYTTQVLIPQLHPMHLEDELPYWGSKRLTEVPASVGFSPAEMLNREPHPFP